MTAKWQLSAQFPFSLCTQIRDLDCTSPSAPGQGYFRFLTLPISLAPPSVAVLFLAMVTENVSLPDARPGSGKVRLFENCEGATPITPCKGV